MGESLTTSRAGAIAERVARQPPIRKAARASSDTVVS